MKKNEIAIFILAGSLIAGIFIMLGVLIFKEIPEANKELIYVVVGALVATLSSIISYFFGSSKGSTEKNEVIKEKLLENK